MRFAHERTSMVTRCDIVEVTVTQISESGHKMRTKDVHFVRTQHTSGAIVEVHANTPVGQGISHSILVAIIDPAHDEYLFVR